MSSVIIIIIISPLLSPKSALPTSSSTSRASLASKNPFEQTRYVVSVTLLHVPVLLLYSDAQFGLKV